MLEIIVLIFLTRQVGEIVEEKGRRSGWYKALTVVLWIGGEVIGAIVGLVVAEVTGSGQFLMYLCALVGAALGAVLAFVIAKSLSPVVAYNTPPPPPTFG